MLGHASNTLVVDKVEADAQGNLLVLGSIKLINDNLQLGTQDAFARNQVWMKIPNSILRLGALGADGDADNVASEGMVIYGVNPNGDFDASNYSLGRFKANRFGIQVSIAGVYEGYIFRFDVTENEWYISKNDGTKVFRIFRNENKIEVQNLQLDGNLTDGIDNLTFAQIKSAVDNIGIPGPTGPAGADGAVGPTGPAGGSLIFTPIVLLDNQATPQLLFSYPKTYRFSFFLFSIERHGAFQQIYTQKVTDGTTVAGGNNSNNVGTTGITITQAVVGDNVEVYYTSTNTGYAGTFKYATLVQWS